MSQFFFSDFLSAHAIAVVYSGCISIEHFDEIRIGLKRQFGLSISKELVEFISLFLLAFLDPLIVDVQPCVSLDICHLIHEFKLSHPLHGVIWLDILF